MSPTLRLLRFFGPLLVALAGFVSCVSVPLEPLPPQPPGLTRVVTLNIRAVAVPDEDPVARATAIAAYIRRTEPDIVMLQEVAVVDGYRIVAPCPLAPVRRSLERTLNSVLEGTRAPTHLAFPRLQIDTILHSDNLALHRAWIDDETVGGAIASDHAAVWAEFAPPVRK